MPKIRLASAARGARAVWSTFGVPGRLMLAYAIVFLTLWAALPQSDTRTWIVDFSYVPPHLMALYVAARLLRERRDLTRRARAAWACVAAAAGFRLVGDVGWWWLEGVRHEEPFPSVADVGYCLFYPFALTALLLLTRGGRRTRARLLDALDIFALAAAAFVAMWYFVLGPVMTSGVGGSVADILNIYYPVADVVLVAAAARILVSSSRVSVPIALVMASCAGFVLADSFFAYISSTGNYSAFVTWPDVPWVAGCVLLPLALDARRRSACEEVGPREARLPSLLPLLGVVAAGAVLVKAVAPLPAYPVGATAVAVVAVMALVALRQLVATRDYAALASEYELLATTDALTHLTSRRAGLERGEALLVRAAGAGDECSVLMLDVDLFKRINDELGHAAGDTVLAEVAARVQASVRQGDLVVRYGGDEFLVVLPVTGAVDAEAMARRIEAGVCASPVCVGPACVPVSVTVGAATVRSPPLDAAMATADARLLSRKNARRAAILPGTADVARHLR